MVMQLDYDTDIYKQEQMKIHGYKSEDEYYASKKGARWVDAVELKKTLVKLANDEATKVFDELRNMNIKGKEYSLKYANTPKDAEAYQAVLDPVTRMPKYHGQERLIADEQIEEAGRWAIRRAGKDSLTRPDVSASHSETGDHLVGTVSDGEGVESHKLSIKESKTIAREAQDGGFDPAKHGISKEAQLSQVRIAYLDQALKAGLTAATITAITQLVPELYKAIDYLIKHGEIDLAQLKKSGGRVITTSGEAFLRGSIAYGVQMALQEGLFGEAFLPVVLIPHRFPSYFTSLFCSVSTSVLLCHFNASYLYLQYICTKIQRCIIWQSTMLILGSESNKNEWSVVSPRKNYPN